MNNVNNYIPQECLYIILGHSGVGKTEFSINLSLSMKNSPLYKDKELLFADLDIVNPYFRSRDNIMNFKKNGIDLITSSPQEMNADVPFIPAEVNRFFDENHCCGVLDIGGGPSGARVLAQFRDKIIIQKNISILYVININRPMINTSEKIIKSINEIEMSAGIKITELVNNTHLLEHTNKETVKKGIEIANEVSSNTGIPILCHVIDEKHYSDELDVNQPVFLLNRKVLKPWESV